MTSPRALTEAELVAAYGERRPTSADLRDAAARVARWTYIPATGAKMLELAGDIAALREALADEIAADQVEAFPLDPFARLEAAVEDMRE